MNIKKGRMKVSPEVPPMSMKTMVDTPSAARYERATLAIRYSGATSAAQYDGQEDPYGDDRHGARRG